MLNNLEKIALSCLLASVPMLAHAQATATPETETMTPEAGQAEADAAPPVAVPVAEPIDGQIVAQGEDTLLAQDMIGLPVYSATGESIGDVNDVIIKHDGTVEGIVIGVGGFLGVGEKDVAFELDKLTLEGSDAEGEPMLVMNVLAEDLATVPAFRTTYQLQREEEAERLQREAEQAYPQKVN